MRLSELFTYGNECKYVENAKKELLYGVENAIDSGDYNSSTMSLIRDILHGEVEYSLRDYVSGVDKDEYK